MGIDSHEVHALAHDLAAAPAEVTAGAARAVDHNTDATARDAQTFAPVRTGYLKAHIRAMSAGLTGTVTSEADYGGYVEHGTSDTPAQPYMRPAADLAGPRLADDLGDVGEHIL
jgi:HK97 gp10 family phage protein